MYMCVLCIYVCIMHVNMYVLRLFQYPTLVTFSWEHFKSSQGRSFSNSYFMRAVFSWNRGEHPQPDSIHIVRDIETLNAKWELSIKSLPLGFKKPCGKGGRKSVRAKEDGGHHQNQATSNNWAKFTRTQITEYHAQGLHGSATVWDLELEEVDICPHP